MSTRSLAVSLVSLMLILPAPLQADEDAPTPAPTIDPLPAGWKHTMDKPEMHNGENTELKTFFDVIAEPKDDSFADWCKRIQKREIKKCPFSDEKDTPLVAKKIGAYNVMTYESSGTLFGSGAHCRIYCVELPNKFARLMVSGDEATWEKAAVTLDDLVKNMK